MAFFARHLRVHALWIAVLAGCGGDRGTEVVDAPGDGAAETGDSGGRSDGSAGSSGAGGSAGSQDGSRDVRPDAMVDSRPPDARPDSPPDTGNRADADGAADSRTDGPTCTADAQCGTGYCVGGTCCAVPCTTPGTCEVAAGAVCVNGNTCRYVKAMDNAACDDGNPCTNNVCFNGGCVVQSPKDCNDSNQCTTDTCNAMTGACVHDPVACDDTNPCTTDSCAPATGCQHADNNAGVCTDNNACTDDACAGGVCVSTPKNCTSLNNDCNVGACVNGTCQAQPTNVNGVCDEGLLACDATGKCNASGQCVGNQDACGALATSCAPCTTEPNCFSGRLCTCSAGPPPAVVINGRCVLGADECNTNPCVTLATCNDPTPDGTVNGDVVCTCPGGYTGDGKTAGTGCADIDECTGNPCGGGVATGGCNGTSPPGSYTCTCAAGYVSVPTPTGPTCVCDLRGTYALSARTNVGWSAVIVAGLQAIEASPPEGVETWMWALRYHTLGTNGITVQTVQCGGTAPDACDTFYGYAHAQYQPNHVWGKTRINAGTTSVSASLLGVVPGGTYTEPAHVRLLGITLDNPSGVWPPCRQCVGVDVGQTCTCGTTQHTVSNRATWVDVDDDGNLGITNLHVPRGGLAIDATVPDPPYVYTEPTACPRLRTPAGTYTYQEWPGTVGFSTFRTNRWFIGSRQTSALSGNSVTFANNQCSIAGVITGPASGRTRVEQRIQGCETCSTANSNACVPGPACDDAQIDSYDNVEQSQRVVTETFSLERTASIDLGPILAMPDGAAKESALNQACNEVRELYCPAGKNCNTP